MLVLGSHTFTLQSIVAEHNMAAEYNHVNVPRHMIMKDRNNDPNE